MKNHKLLVSVLLAIGIVASSAAQVTKVKDGYLFRVKYKRGQVMKFSSTISPDNKGSAAGGWSVSMAVTLSVLSVGNGLASVQISTGGGYMGNSKTPVLPPQSTKVQLDDHNRMDSSKNSTGVGPALPEKPVRVGSTWEAVRAFNLPTGIKSLNAVYRFVGMKAVNGRQVAVITYTLNGAASGSGSMTLSSLDGSLIGNETLISVPSMDAVTRFKTVMKRTL